MGCGSSAQDAWNYSVDKPKGTVTSLTLLHSGSTTAGSANLHSIDSSLAGEAKRQAKLQAFRAQYGEEECPEAGCRVHFSGALMNDEFIGQTASIPYVEDSMSEYVGKGQFPDNSLAFPKAIENSFDSIAVDAGTRVTIYSEPNFKGHILWDKVGPAIVVNIKWKDQSYWPFCQGKAYSQKLAGKWEEPLNTIFPPSAREFSKTDMHLWNKGSLVIQGGQAIPKNLKNNNAEYGNLSNATY